MFHKFSEISKGKYISSSNFHFELTHFMAESHRTHFGVSNVALRAVMQELFAVRQPEELAKGRDAMASLIGQQPDESGQVWS